MEGLAIVTGILLLELFYSGVEGQGGTRTETNYYFGYFTNYNNTEQQPSLIITTSESQPVFYSIEAPGIGYYTTGSVTSDSEVIINLPTTLITSSHNDQDKGIHLMISSDRVTVIGQNVEIYTSDSFLCLPITNLCANEYVHYGVTVPRATIHSAFILNSILVVGTEDNTMMNLTVTQPVTISVSDSTVNLTAGIQYSFVISRLQTVLIGSVDDLTGTKLVTDKPVSVLSGHQCGNVPVDVAGCDHLIEQVPPTTLWGTVYYTAPLATRRSYTIKVLAAYNSTVVDIYCSNTRESYSISEGEYVKKTLSLQEVCAITSSKEVLVVQLSHGRRDDGNDTEYGDPMMTLVPATNQYSNKFQFSTLQGLPSFTHYINIIVLAQYYQPDMIYLISGGVNRSLDTYQWVPIMVNDIIEAYSLQLGILEGVAEISHSSKAAMISVIVYGFDDRHGYGNPGGITFQGPPSSGNITTTSMCVNGFTISWDPFPSNPICEPVSYEVTLLSSDRVIMVMEITDTFYNFTGLTPDNSYTVTVASRNHAGMRESSMIVVNTPTIAEALPTGMLNPRIFSDEDLVTITWDPASNPYCGGVLYYLVVVSFCEWQVQRVSTTGLNVTFDDLIDRTPYSIMVVAINRAGYGSNETINAVTKVDDDDDELPTGVIIVICVVATFIVTVPITSIIAILCYKKWCKHKEKEVKMKNAMQENSQFVLMDRDVKMDANPSYATIDTTKMDTNPAYAVTK
ncbi:uncharacterized protein [Dysidea avara]|uniref:uncharacterized protein isoform X3 n=1 Tax=Dysidea avara TaxID=196820 RepID=UPI003321DAB7